MFNVCVSFAHLKINQICADPKLVRVSHTTHLYLFHYIHVLVNPAVNNLSVDSN